MDLLADRLAQGLGLGGREPGELLRDLHVLLLVDADRVRPAGDRLQTPVGERHLLAPRLARRVHRDVAHRPRPVEGHERDEVLELGRLDRPQGLAHARRLELEDAGRVAAGEHLVRLRVVERERADVDPADELDGLVDDVEVAQAEEVHLQQAELDDVAHVQLGDDLRARALLLQGDDLDERLGADDDAGRVDRVRAREPLERPREVDDLLRDRVRLDGLLQLAVPERGVQGLARAFGDHLRDAVDDAVGDVEHAPRVADRRAGGHRRERDDLGDAVAAVLLGDVVDDAVAAGDREVDVHVREVGAGRVQEALEEEAVAHRVDVRDLEAVRRQRARRRAAARPDADTVALREVDEVPDDEEVVREPHLLDRLELEAEPLRELGGGFPVAADETLLAELHEVVERVAPFGDGELRQQDPPQLELDVAALGDLQRARHRVLEAREVARHLLGGLEEELVRVELPVLRVLQRVAGLDAEERLVRERIVGVEVVDVARRDEGKPGGVRKLGEPGNDAGLLLEPGVLELDVRRVAAEDLREPVEVGASVVATPLRESARDAARETSREGDDALRVTLEQLPVDARLVVVALEVAERRELDEVRVALVRLGEEREVRVALGLRVPVLGHVDLAADDRLDAGLARLAVQLDGARQRAVVGERHGRHVEPCCLLDERRDPARPVEDRVLRVDVEMDERRSGHGTATLSRSSAVLILLDERPFRRLRRTRTGPRASARCRADRRDPSGAGAPSTASRERRDRPRDPHFGPPPARARTRSRDRLRARGRAGVRRRAADREMYRGAPCGGYRHGVGSV